MVRTPDFGLPLSRRRGAAVSIPFYDRGLPVPCRFCYRFRGLWPWRSERNSCYHLAFGALGGVQIVRLEEQESCLAIAPAKRRWQLSLAFVVLWLPVAVAYACCLRLYFPLDENATGRFEALTTKLLRTAFFVAVFLSVIYVNLRLRPASQRTILRLTAL